MKTHVLICLLTLCVGQCLLAQEASQKKRIEEIANKFHIPGLSLAYQTENEKWEFLSVGVRNKNESALVDENTVFSAASLSKPITAYIALRLVQQGKLDLLKPLSQYFDYDVLMSKAGYKIVTTEMILTHQSGLPNWRNEGQLEFNDSPGTTFSYSGEGFVWLQKVIEEIEERPFEQVADGLVFDPLNMNHTSFVWMDQFEANFATPHDELMYPSLKWKPDNANAAGSLQTTATDYARFLQELLDPKHLSIELRDRMLTPQVKVKSYHGGKESVNWGLGIGLQESKEGLEMWHWGNNGDDRAFFAVSLTQNKGLVYFTNSKNGLAMTDQLTDVFLATPQPGYKWNGFKGQGKSYRLKSTFRKKNTYNK